MRALNLRTLSVGTLILMAAIGCGNGNTGKNGAGNGVATKVTDVRVTAIEPREFLNFIEVTGTVKADIMAEISAEESGVIERFYKEKGDWVEKGQQLVKLESKVLQASFEEAKASYLLSQATFERQKNLYDDRVISEQKYLEFKYSLDRDRARFENLKARLDKTVIESPISGFLDSRFKEIGEFVLPGTPLVKIVKTDLVKVSADVPEQFIEDVHAGTEAFITFDVLPKDEFSGKISFIGPSIKKSTRTFPIEIILTNQDNRLKPEMFADVKIREMAVDSAIVIPRDAIIETETGKYVFVANQSMASKREVTIGASYNEQILISEGLDAGEQLIVVGHRDLVDGDRIAVHR